MTTLQMYGTTADSIVDGPGLRYGVFVQGCPHHCPGCHNPESQPFEGGFPLTVEQIVSDIEANKLITGVTLSGGEPFSQCAGCIELARELKARGYSVWVYSGFLYEDLMAGNPDPLAPELLAICDVLVDGPFVQARRSYDLIWKGSSNQRVIDLRVTEASGRIVLWQEETLDFQKPESW